MINVRPIRQMAGHLLLHEHSPDGRPCVVVGCPCALAVVLCCLHGSKWRGNVPPKSQLGLPDWSNKRFSYLKMDSIRWTRFKRSCQYARRDNMVCVLLCYYWDCGNSTGRLLAPKECVLNFDGVGLGHDLSSVYGRRTTYSIIGIQFELTLVECIICSNATIGSVVRSGSTQF